MFYNFSDATADLAPHDATMAASIVAWGFSRSSKGDRMETAVKQFSIRKYYNANNDLSDGMHEMPVVAS